MNDFFLLYIAHILADFYLQPTSWVLHKRKKTYRSQYLYLHTLVVIVLSYLFLGKWAQPQWALLLGLLHGVTDLIKISFDKKNKPVWFVADQLAHLLTIVLIALLINDHFSFGFNTFQTWLRNPKPLAIAAGAFSVLNPISFLVGIFTKRWRDELMNLAPNVDDNLADAGKWIGMSERLLIYIFVLTSQFSAIGFLIAAKSLLRYNDKAPATDISPAYISKKSEYVLVGTLMSYTCAIGVALLVKLCY